MRSNLRVFRSPSISNAIQQHQNKRSFGKASKIEREESGKHSWNYDWRGRTFAKTTNNIQGIGMRKKMVPIIFLSLARSRVKTTHTSTSAQLSLLISKDRYLGNTCIRFNLGDVWRPLDSVLRFYPLRIKKPPLPRNLSDASSSALEVVRAAHDVVGMPARNLMSVVLGWACLHHHPRPRNNRWCPCYYYLWLTARW